MRHVEAVQAQPKNGFPEKGRKVVWESKLPEISHFRISLLLESIEFRILMSEYLNTMLPGSKAAGPCISHWDCVCQTHMAWHAITDGGYRDLRPQWLRQTITPLDAGPARSLAPIGRWPIGVRCRKLGRKFGRYGRWTSRGMSM